MYMPQNSIVAQQSWIVRLIIWEAKNHMDLDDAEAAMSTGGMFYGQVTSGQPETLASAYVDPDLVRVHVDKIWNFDNRTNTNTAYFKKFSKMIKLKRGQVFDFNGNAGTSPRNRQIWTSLYFMCTSAATAQYLYGSGRVKLYIKDK